MSRVAEHLHAWAKNHIAPGSQLMHLKVRAQQAALAARSAMSFAICVALSWCCESLDSKRVKLVLRVMDGDIAACIGCF